MRKIPFPIFGYFWLVISCNYLSAQPIDWEKSARTIVQDSASAWVGLFEVVIHTGGSYSAGYVTRPVHSTLLKAQIPEVRPGAAGNYIDPVQFAQHLAASAWQGELIAYRDGNLQNTLSTEQLFQAGMWLDTVQRLDHYEEDPVVIENKLEWSQLNLAKTKILIWYDLQDHQFKYRFGPIGMIQRDTPLFWLPITWSETYAAIDSSAIEWAHRLALDIPFDSAQVYKSTWTIPECMLDICDAVSERKMVAYGSDLGYDFAKVELRQEGPRDFISLAKFRKLDERNGRSQLITDSLSFSIESLQSVLLVTDWTWNGDTNQLTIHPVASAPRKAEYDYLGNLVFELSAFYSLYPAYLQRWHRTD